MLSSLIAPNSTSRDFTMVAKDNTKSWRFCDCVVVALHSRLKMMHHFCAHTAATTDRRNAIIDSVSDKPKRSVIGSGLTACTPYDSSYGPGNTGDGQRPSTPATYRKRGRSGRLFCRRRRLVRLQRHFYFKNRFGTWIPVEVL